MKGEGLMFSGRGHDGVTRERGYSSERGEMSLIDGRGGQKTARKTIDGINTSRGSQEMTKETG